MTLPSLHSIRAVVPDDYAQLALVYAQIFPHQNISEATIKKIFRDEPAQILVSVTDKNTIAGFLYFWILREELQVIDVGVLTAYRRHGIARSLFEHLLALPKNATVETVTLEVNSNNAAAIALYKNLGFIQTGMRPKYYSDGGDALLMDLLF